MGYPDTHVHTGLQSNGGLTLSREVHIDNYQKCGVPPQSPSHL